MNRFAATALLALCIALPTRALAVDVLTYHNDNLRTGWNDAETTLTPSLLSGGGLKQRFVRDLGGLSYGQPLVATSEPTAKGTVDLVVVATDHDDAIAFNARNGSLVWARSLVPSGESIVTSSFTGCLNMMHAGVASTPVIDRTRDTVYVVTETLFTNSKAQQHVRFRLYSLSLATGLNKRPPSVISARLPSGQGPIAFLADYQQQRSALVIANNRVYVGFGSTCDFNGNLYHGWLFAYDADSLKQVATYTDTPIAGENGNFMGGIWMSGSGPTVDARGNLLFITGNGMFDGRIALSDSAVKITPDLSRVIDYFTPYTMKSDNDSDSDFGSGGLMLFPDIAGLPSIAVGQGKDGILTMMDQKRLGRFQPGGPDHVLAELALGATWSSPAYFAGPGAEYVFTTGGPLYGIKVRRSPARMSIVQQSHEQFPMNNGNGETPAISSNGNDPKSAIVWIVSWQSDRTLHLLAYSAIDLSQVIFSAPLGPWRFPQTNSIQVPTIANGMVYVAGFHKLYAYGSK